MIGNVSSNFSDLIVIGEMIEMGIKKGKIVNMTNGPTSAKRPSLPADKKKWGEANVVMSMPIMPDYNHIPYMPNFRPQFMFNLQITSVSQIPYQPPCQPGMMYRPPPLPQILTSTSCK